MARVLYISYDGLMEPLGQSQVLQYLKKLSADHEIIILSYEKVADWNDIERRNKVLKDIKSSHLRWFPLRYHKRPSALATVFDLAMGLLISSVLIFRQKIQIVHARSYVPAVIALVLKLIFRKKFVFDMRGFWGDERVDGGLWPEGSSLYRVVKWLEKKFLLYADTIVSLTHAGVRMMKQFPYLSGRKMCYEVIPTCTNLDLFSKYLSTKNNIASNNFTLGYVGSVGTWYLFDEVLETFKILLDLKPEARLLIINRTEHAYIRQRLESLNMPEKSVEIRKVEFQDMPNSLAEIDAGIFFIKPVFSKMASSPTKMGEFLACGIPCLANSGVGDVEEILLDEGVGVVLDDFSITSQKNSINSLLRLVSDPSMNRKCISTAKKYFSLERGVQRYDNIYKTLVEKC